MNQTPAKAHRTLDDENQGSPWSNRPAQSETRTPRFILGPPASQGPNTQFASTPRFLFGGGGSQSQRAHVSDEINQDDQEDSPGLKRPAHRRRPSAGFHGEAIRDSDSESANGHGSISSGHGDDRPGQTMADKGGDDDDMLLSLSPVLPSVKRRRRFSHPSSHGEPVPAVAKISGTDIISSSPESPSSTSIKEHMSPPSELPEHEIATPTRRELFSSSRRESQGASSARDPHFIVNTRQADPPAPGVQGPPQILDIKATSALESTPRPKPRFVLPSTPDATHSEKKTGPMTSPTPFSPLAHRTKRGRAGSLAKPDLIPNGMAAEVRNWIFEIGAKRQVTSHSPTPGSLMFSPTRPTQGETDTGASQINSRERHYLTTKVASVKNTLCSDEDQRSHPNNYTASAGHPAPFILATPCRQGPGLGHPLADEILLFNPPLRVAARSTVPGFLSLKEGDCIGVRKGLVWEVEMDTTVTGVIPVGEGNADTAEEVAHTCLVGVEWDILD